VAGDENLIKEIEKNALKAAQATAGLPPLPLDATPEQVEAYRAAERNLHNFKEKMAFRKEVESRVLSSIVRKLVAENEALKKRVSGAADANRPESSTTSAPPTPKKVNYSGNYEDAPNPHLTGR
jgi:hypothetical protein